MADDELPYGVSHGRGVAHMRGVANSVGPPVDEGDVAEGDDAEVHEAEDGDESIQATARERREARGWVEFGPSKD